MVPVNGRAMLDYVIERYRPLVDLFVLVVSPEARPMVEQHCREIGAATTVVVQETPTGMLDAILIPADLMAVREAEEVWITWCDQIAVSGATAQRLAATMTAQPRPALALPTMQSNEPYIHFQRDPTGRIWKVLHRREGDSMPAMGESDIGLFAMRANVYLTDLARYAGSAQLGGRTGERNFLPFIPWLAAQSPVSSFPAADPMEAVGINTPEDLDRVATYLKRIERP
jgi:molybdopterin-guanine dinucleotide biosynthesis protein A